MNNSADKNQNIGNWNNSSSQNPWGNYQNQYSNNNNASNNYYGYGNNSNPNYNNNNNNYSGYNTNYNPYSSNNNSDAPYQNMNNYQYGGGSNINNLENFGISGEQQNIKRQSSKIIDLQSSARVNFIRKVYTILSIQLLVTVFMCYLSMSSKAFFLFQIQNSWLLWVALITAFFIQIYMFCCGGGRTFPGDWICVSLFTICEAYVVSFICSATGMQSGNDIVFLAAFLTLVIVVALTLYALFTPRDFTTCGGIIIILGVILLLLFIILLFTDSKAVTVIYCCVGVFLFGIYLIIDTQLILGGKTYQLGIDQYCLGAMLLYIDIIQIFLYILELLQTLNRQ